MKEKVMNMPDQDAKKIFCESFTQLYISDFCGGDLPLDTDLFIEKLDALENNVICFGLGEYIFLTAQENFLRNLKDKTFPNKIIFICRGISNFLERLADEDPKFQANRICRVQGKLDFSVVKYNPKINVSTDAENFTELLKLLERENLKTLSLKSELPLLNVKEINSFYDAIKFREAHFSAPRNSLNELQWRDYFFDDNCAGYPPEHCRTFAAGFKNKFANTYLKYVFEMSTNYDDYKKKFGSRHTQCQRRKKFCGILST